MNVAADGVTRSRLTTHHATRREAHDACRQQIADARAYMGSTRFEVVRTNVGDAGQGTVDRFAVRMTWVSV